MEKKKKKGASFFSCLISRIKRCMALCQTPCRTQHHSVPRQQQRPKFPPSLPCLQTETWTHVKSVGETCSRRSERPRKCSWVVQAHNQEWVTSPVRELFQASKQEWVTSPAHVIHNLNQSTPERCWVIIESRGAADVHVAQSQNTEWFDFVLDTKSVQNQEL